MTDPTFTPSHLGLCVADLERALRFYCDGLGFTSAEAYPIGNEWGNSLEVEGEVKLTSHFVRKDGMAIELLHYESPGHAGDGSPRAMNQLGLTHLSFRVDDLAAAAARLEAHGARVLRATRIDNPQLRAKAVFATDPDGTLIELVETKPRPA